MAPPPTISGSPPRRSRLRLLLFLGVLALVLGGLLAGLAQRPMLSGTVFYPLMLLYYSGAGSLATVILLLALTLLTLWIPQLVRRTPRFWLNGLAAGLALVGALLACWGSLPPLVETYRHIDRAELGGQVYQLGARFAAADSAYVLCGCDRWGLFCHCRPLPEAGPVVFDQRPELRADPADGTLAIWTGSRLVASVRP
jgi:hypothetical protein